MQSSSVGYASAVVPPPFDPASLPPGTLISGKYVLGKPLGYGRHSVIYEATHRYLQRKAAVKILAETDGESDKRFRREARLAGALDHPNIVEIYELGRLEDQRAFLVMEHLEGETVYARLERQGPFSIALAAQIGQELLLGLAAAHEKQIVHRDLRPENLFLAQLRDHEVLKILDFGISRRFGDNADSSLTAPGEIVGSFAWLAPEQVYEGTELDARVDLYATGVLLFRLLTGTMPYTAKGPALLISIVEEPPPAASRFRPELPPDVDAMLRKAMAKTPADRFQTAAEMSEALRLLSLFADYVDA